jgi:hypothetical protein
MATATTATRISSPSLSGLDEIKDGLRRSLLASPANRRRLEKFLGIKISMRKKNKTTKYKSKNSRTGYKQRVQDDEGKISPHWEVFAARDDKSRTYIAHKEMINIKAAHIALEKPNMYSVESHDPPDPAALTALLNIIGSINPTLHKPERIDKESLEQDPMRYKNRAANKFSITMNNIR